MLHKKNDHHHDNVALYNNFCQTPYQVNMTKKSSSYQLARDSPISYIKQNIGSLTTKTRTMAYKTWFSLWVGTGPHHLWCVIFGCKGTLYFGHSKGKYHNSPNVCGAHLNSHTHKLPFSTSRNFLDP